MRSVDAPSNKNNGETRYEATADLYFWQIDNR